MLSQLEDSLSIEVTVVALPSIGEDIPAEFAHKLFEHWGIGKKADDNGLLILLVLDQRKVTFATGYGLEGVLPDALCFRIQQNEMVPWFRKNDFDRGITEGVRAVTLVLYGRTMSPFLKALLIITGKVPAIRCGIFWQINRSCFGYS